MRGQPTVSAVRTTEGFRTCLAPLSSLEEGGAKMPMQNEPTRGSKQTKPGCSVSAA